MIIYFCDILKIFFVEYIENYKVLLWFFNVDIFFLD